MLSSIKLSFRLIILMTYFSLNLKLRANLSCFVFLNMFLLNQYSHEIKTRVIIAINKQPKSMKIAIGTAVA